MPIDARKSHSHIVEELIREYKETGKIGNSEPKDMKSALKQANAIAYDVKGNSKLEALQSYIKSLIRPENKAFIENTVLKGFSACFENQIGELDKTPVRLMGRVFYYDPTEGKYYEPSTDKFLELDEYDALKKSDDIAQRHYVNKINDAIKQAKSPKQLNTLINAKHLYWDQDSARDAENLAIQLTEGAPKNMVESDQAIINLDEPTDVQIQSDEDGVEGKEPVTINPDNLTQQENDAIKVQMDETQKSKNELEKKAEELSDQATEYEENADKLRNAAAAVSIEQ